MSDKFGEVEYRGKKYKTLIYVDFTDIQNHYGFNYKTHMMKVPDQNVEDCFVVEFTKIDKSEHYVPSITFPSFDLAETYVSGFLSCLGMRKKAGF